MRINIETIPKDKMRYNTVGDYWYDETGCLQVRVADMGDEFYEKMVVIHELVEEALTKKRGLKEEQILEYDLFHEKKIEMGLINNDVEVGFTHDSPYLREHSFATSVELGMCAMSGVNWIDYENAVNNL